jgi:hypothetical protein
MQKPIERPGKRTQDLGLQVTSLPLPQVEPSPPIVVIDGAGIGLPGGQFLSQPFSSVRLITVTRDNGHGSVGSTGHEW